MNIVSSLLPLALIGCFGFIAGKLRWVDKAQSDAVSKVCFSLLIPIFLFVSTYQADLSEQISFYWFLSFYLPVAVMMLGVFVWQYKIKQLTRGEAAIAALVASYSNTVIVAIPVLHAFLAPDIAARAFVLIAFHGAIVFTLTECFINRFRAKTLLLGFRNPIVMSILTGLVFNLFNVPLFDWLLAPMNKLSKAAIPLALLALGSAMAFMPIRGNRTQSLQLSLVKLLLLPALVYACASTLFDLTDVQVAIVVILSASPTAAVSYLIAVKHESFREVAASTVVTSTILAFVSHLFWLYFLF